MKQLEFYFDYLSPYAYFAWHRVESFCTEHKLDLTVTPVVFAKLLDNWGQLGPAEVPPKREWLIKYCLFYAKENKLPFSMPKYHPFNSLPALRASLPAVSGVHQRDLVSAIFNAGWGQGLDIGDVELIGKLAADVGLDPGLLEKDIRSDNVKSMLRENTDRALSNGVFGVPTMIYGGHLLWGNDQFEFLSALIQGGFDIDSTAFNDIINRPGSANRKKT